MPTDIDTRIATLGMRKVEPHPGELTRYEVSCGGEVIGHVSSGKVLTYRGKDGWCRGVRLRDFHPTRWNYHTPGDDDHRRTCYSRRDAVRRLLEAIATTEPANAHP